MVQAASCWPWWLIVAPVLRPSGPVSQGWCANKSLVISALHPIVRTSSLPPLRSYPAVRKKLMPNPFRGASSSSERPTFHTGFEDPDDQQQRCRGRWTVSRYFWTSRGSRQMRSRPSSCSRLCQRTHQTLWSNVIVYRSCLQFTVF